MTDPLGELRVFPESEPSPETTSKWTGSPEVAEALTTTDCPARDAAALCSLLMEQNIVTSFRDSNIRATIHFYNSADDIEVFVAAMRAARARFHPG